MLPILVTCHNRVGFTEKCLNNLVKVTDIPFTLFIWDNASTDGTRDYLMKSWAYRAEIVFSNRNVGLTGALNTFFKIYAPRAKWLANVDNDTLPPPGWAEDLIAAASLYGLKAIQGTHSVLGRPGFFDNKWGIGTYKGETIYKSGCIGASGAVFNTEFIYENGLLLSTQMFDATETWYKKGGEAGHLFGFSAATPLELQDMNADCTRKMVYPEYDKMVNDYRQGFHDRYT